MPELLLPGNIISMDARAADRLTACGNGDAALLYLWLLRHGGVLDPAQARKGLKWDGQRLEEASAALGVPVVPIGSSGQELLNAMLGI